MSRKAITLTLLTLAATLPLAACGAGISKDALSEICAGEIISTRSNLTGWEVFTDQTHCRVYRGDYGLEIIETPYKEITTKENH